jgi:ectoine hydroxylase-related dioxygenase (phytanoyl-CoA dioxygenase family)
MAASIARVPRSTTSAELCALLERDGVFIMEDALEPLQLQRLNDELDERIEATAPGIEHPDHEFFIEFYGTSTKRIDGLPAKSRTFVELMLSPLLTQVADYFLLPNCKDYLFNTGQVIEIGPGETAQKLHRDEDAWVYCPKPDLEVEVEAMFALTDFSSDNGATHVIPGSHRWARDRRGLPEESVQAEMKAGSAVFYLGSTLHGGGSNRTAHERRRGMFLGYVVGWLRTEENTFLTVPLEQVRHMPVRAQELLGYKSHVGIGVVDVGSPMKLLSS